MKNANEKRINFTTNPVSNINMLFTNNSFSNLMFSNSNCTSWPNSCIWDNILNSTISTDRTRTSTINFTINSINYTWNYTADTFAPNVSVINPQTDIWTKNAFNYFFYNTTDDKDILNCSLMINNKLNTTNISIQKNIQLNFSQTFSDGFINWSINCSDNTSYRNTGNSSTRLLKIDLTPPNVSLESPANNTAWTTSQTILFKYNTTDNLGNSSCSLYIDGNFDQSKDNVAQKTSMNFSASTSNGLHNWTINCSDEAGNVGSGGIFNVSVSYAGPAILAEFTDYIQGDIVNIIGTNWGFFSNISINLTKSNWTTLNWTLQANGTGYFNFTYNISYGDPLGRFNLTAKNILVGSENSSTYFNVQKREVFVSTNKSTYVEGQTVFFNGTGMSPNTKVNINITSPSSTYNLTVNANSTGDFNSSWNIYFFGPPGTYNLTAWDHSYNNLNYTTNFLVTNRIANLSTNKSSYAQNELVIINGSWYYPLGTVSIIIMNLENGGITSLNNDSDTNGDIGTNWNTTDACDGNYTIIAEDQTRPPGELKAEVNFTINSGQVNFNESKTPYSVEGNAVTPTLSSVNLSDGTEQIVVNGGGIGNYWLIINFSNNLPVDASISEFTFVNEHRVSSTTRITRYSVLWLNGSNYQTICTLVPSTTAKINDSCDMTSIINTRAKANHVSIMVNYSKTASQAAEAYVDFTRLYFNYSTPKACTAWANYPPQITQMWLGDAYTPGQINLLAGITTDVFCNATIYDSNGAGDIVKANATIYLIGSEGAADNPNNHYSNESCSCGAISLYNSECACGFSVQHYASNGTWYCNMTVWDSKDALSTNISNATINEFVYLNLTTEGNLVLDFGDINPGENSSASKIVNITNSGNIPINISVYAYANVSGDNMSMMCEDGRSWINTSYLRYNLTDQGWSGMFEVNGTATAINGFLLAKRIGVQETMNSTYWRFGVPPATIGICNGTLVFLAKAG